MFGAKSDVTQLPVGFLKSQYVDTHIYIYICVVAHAFPDNEQQYPQARFRKGTHATIGWIDGAQWRNKVNEGPSMNMYCWRYEYVGRRGWRN